MTYGFRTHPHRTKPERRLRLTHLSLISVLLLAFLPGVQSSSLGTPNPPVPAPSQEWSQLSTPRILTSGGTPINVSGGHAAPAVFDMDGDGKKDLVVGQFEGGKLRCYRNIGSNAEPKFNGFQYVAVHGKEVSVPYG